MSNPKGDGPDCRATKRFLALVAWLVAGAFFGIYLLSSPAISKTVYICNADKTRCVAIRLPGKGKPCIRRVIRGYKVEVCP